MEYVSVSQIASRWQISERMVRNYCAAGLIANARLVGKTWMIPADAVKPIRQKRRTVHAVLKEEMESHVKGGVYHGTQITMAYNSNHIEGSHLTQEQTRFIFETHSILPGDTALPVDDIIETVNHFKCLDMIIAKAKERLSERFIKKLHGILKANTSQSGRFAIGDYKTFPNEVGMLETTTPTQVTIEMQKLLEWYNSFQIPELDDILDFHVRFERIHPFQDGNGRIGRLIMFKECLRCGIVPFIIHTEFKHFYYNGLQNWPKTKGYLRDTCLAAQDAYKCYLNKFNIIVP